MPAPFFQGPRYDDPIDVGPTDFSQGSFTPTGNPFAQLLAMAQQQAPQMSDPDPRLPEDHPLGQHDILPPGGPAANPGFIQFMNEQDPHDLAMAGAIAALGVRDPKTAVQWALQFKQHRDQRAFQAQQNELQRQAVQENVKLRAQYESEQKKRAEGEKKMHLAQSKAFQLGVSIPEWEAANNTVLDETTVDRFLNYASAEEQKRKLAADAEKQKAKDFDQQRKVLGDFASGKLPHETKTPWDGNPDWEASRAAAEVVGKQRRDYTTARNQSRLEIDKLIAKLKALDLQQKPAEGAVKSPKYKQALVELQEANKHVTDTENDIDALIKGSQGTLVPVDYSKDIAAKQGELTIAQDRYQKALDNARSLAGGTDIDLKKEAPEKTTKSAIDAIRERLNAAPAH